LETKNSLKGILTRTYTHKDFNTFYSGIKAHFESEYEITDEPMFKSLMHTFYIVANTEQKQIIKKMTQDEDYDRTVKRREKKRISKAKSEQSA